MVLTIFFIGKFGMIVFVDYLKLTHDCNQLSKIEWANLL